MKPQTTVAIIDHDPTFVRLLQNILQIEGFATVFTHSGEKAHPFVVDKQPDVIVIDTWLNDREEGWTLLQTLSLDPLTVHIPIIVCSSDAEMVKERAERLDTPSVTILLKPFDADKFIAAVKEALANDDNLVLETATA